LKEQGRTAWLRRFLFADAICNFRDFKNRVGFGLDAFELASAVKRGDPLAEVVEGQGFLSGERRL